jgi:hypothetical protein
MISKSLTPLRQKDIRTGAEQERKRILAYLEKLYDDEYGRTLTLGKVIWLIKEENK